MVGGPTVNKTVPVTYLFQDGVTDIQVNPKSLASIEAQKFDVMQSQLWGRW
jgi:hypothetical protein